MENRRGKVVRDGIPECIFKEEGWRPKYRTLSGVDWMRALQEKLVEEAHELEAISLSGERLTQVQREQVLEELADIAEVSAAIRIAFNVTSEAVNKRRRRKRIELGGFAKRIFLEEW